MRNLILLPLLISLLACARAPEHDAVRTPLWVLGGEGIVYAQVMESRLMRSAPPRLDLHLTDAARRNDERLLRGIDNTSLHPGAVSPDGQRLACTVGTGESMDLVLVDLTTGESRRLLEDTSLRPLSICWDPPGRRIAVSHAEEPIVILIDTEAMGIARIPSRAPIIGDWRPGLPDQLILVSDPALPYGNSLSLWTPGSEEAPTVVFEAHSTDLIGSVRADPLGRLVAFFIQEPGNSRTTLMLLDLVNGTPIPVWESPRPLVGLRWSEDGRHLCVSQLGRERESGWTLFRLPLSTRTLEPLGEHFAGWDLSPDGMRLVLAGRRGLSVVALPTDAE